MCLNYSLFDIDNGVLCKLGDDKEVLVGLRGKQILSYDELVELYGSPVPKYTHINWPQMHKFPERD